MSVSAVTNLVDLGLKEVRLCNKCRMHRAHIHTYVHTCAPTGMVCTHTCHLRFSLGPGEL